MLCEEVSHGKVCDKQGERAFGDVLKFRSEQKLTDEERLGWLSKDISFMGVLHVCRRGNLEKREVSKDRKEKTSFECLDLLLGTVVCDGKAGQEARQDSLWWMAPSCLQKKRFNQDAEDLEREGTRMTARATTFSREVEMRMKCSSAR